MAKRPKTTAPPPPSLASPSLKPALVLLTVAVLGSGYLAVSSLLSDSLPGCGPDSGCDKVLHSRWGYWLGLPVSVPGFLVYAALLGFVLQLSRTTNPERRARQWSVVVGLLVVTFSSILWFTGLQAVVLKSFCKFCLTVHAGGFVAGVLLLRASPLLHRPSGKAKASPTTPVLRLGAPVGAGLVAVALLAAGQVFVTRETSRVTMAGGAKVEAAKPAAPRLITLHEGAFQFDMTQVPVVGPLDAPHVLVSLFDYTCHHCKELHEVLHRVRQEAGPRLAIISLPMPLDANCNSLVKKTPEPHTGACDYARYGLAVWKADPASFAKFDDWIFSPPRPPSLLAVKEYAESLVGTQRLARAFSDPWIERQIQTDIALFRTNSLKTRSGVMPQLVAGSAISVGPVRDIAKIRQLLDENLGLKLDGQSTNNPH